MYSRLLEEYPLQEYLSHETIVDRFGHVASIYGGRVALTSHNGEALTYQELDELSDRVASALVSTLGPRNVPIALMFDHSIEQVISILGTLSELSPDTAILEYKNLVEHPLINFEKHVTPGSGAGIYFTSGTIKQPKGIQRTHRQILHRVWFSSKLCKLGPEDRISGIRQCGLGRCGRLSGSDQGNSVQSGRTHRYPVDAGGESDHSRTPIVFYQCHRPFSKSRHEVTPNSADKIPLGPICKHIGERVVRETLVGSSEHDDRAFKFSKT